MNSIETDMEKICRVCLSRDQELFLIFDEKYAEEKTNLAAMLSECTIYKVERFDELPHFICGPCMLAVQNSFRFKRKCERNYRVLLDLVGVSSKHQTRSIKIETGDFTEKSTQTDEGSLYPCERCDNTYFSFDALKAHREQEHKGSAIICRFCLKKFNRIGYLKSHIAIFHPDCGYKSHNQCHICKRQFTRREHMRRHLAVIHKIVETKEESPEPLEIVYENDIEGKAKKPEALTDSVDMLSDKILNTHEPTIMDIQESMYDDNKTDNKIEIEKGTVNLMESVALSNENCEDSNDEKPLVNFINANNGSITGFIEVMINESHSMEKLSENVEDSECENKSSLSTISSLKENSKVDILSVPVKRGRGRPKRVKINSSSSSDELQQDFKCNRSSLQDRELNQSSDFATEILPCKICSKSFENAEDLHSHVNSIHKASKIFKCDDCGKVFTHATQYKRHKETKHSEKIHKCEICSKGFTTKIYLQRHIAIHYKKRYVCKECSQSYSTKEELNAHIKADGHDKPMLCPECGLRCRSNNILMVHMRRHNGEKPFKCKFCSKGFPRMDDLRVHEKYHTGEKSHFCDTCGKGFQRKYNLTIHLRVHTGEKPYKCGHCPQAFAQGNDLKAHIRRHTGERFRCEVCGAAFLQGYQIRQHKLQEHGIKEDPPTQRVAKFTSPEEQEKQIKQNLQREMENSTEENKFPKKTTIPISPKSTQTNAFNSETIEDFLI